MDIFLSGCLLIAFVAAIAAIVTDQPPKQPSPRRRRSR